MRRVLIRHPPCKIALELYVLSMAKVKEVGYHLVLILLGKGRQLVFDFLNAHLKEDIPPRGISQACGWEFVLPNDPSERPSPTTRPGPETEPSYSQKVL